MPDYLVEREIQFPVDLNSRDLSGQVEAKVLGSLSGDESPVRFVVTESDDRTWSCEVGLLSKRGTHESIFRLVKRTHCEGSQFNVVMLVPTGIGADIGGHAGDATPAATLLASVCDTLVTHPNVLNASDIIQIPQNALYVEGSVITRLLMGTVGLRSTRANRILVIVQDHWDRMFRDAAYNAVNAARSTYGIRVSGIVDIGRNFKMIAEHMNSGRAAGRVGGLEHLWRALDQYRGTYDAVAINSVIEVPDHFHRDYYAMRGGMVNPWGGVEAILTHAVSSMYGVPAAHSPMFESREVSEIDLGVVDCRMAAEAISLTFLQSILRGLQHSPRITLDPELTGANVLTAEDISCLVIPEGCLGLPTLAALQQGINVIAVRENQNIMRNDLSALPWNPGQYFLVDNYWEAAGLIATMRVGLDPASVRRPFEGIEPSNGSPVASANSNGAQDIFPAQEHRVQND